MRYSGNKYIVRKVSVIDTLRNIPQGETVTFLCRDLGSYGTVSSAVKRLNEGSEGRYTYETTDFGMTYTVTHHKV